MPVSESSDMVERFFRAMHEGRHRWPRWLQGLERPHAGEARMATHAVAITERGRMTIHIEDEPGGIDRFNHEYPRNGMLAILIYPSYDDSRILDKSLKFLDREWIRIRSSRRH